MSNPRPESRIKSLEQRATDIEANIVELSADAAEELKAIRQDIKKLDEGMMTSFKKIGDTFIETVANKEDLEPLATKEDLSKLEARFDKVEATQVEHSHKIDEQGTMLRQILQLLQQKSGE